MEESDFLRLLFTLFIFMGVPSLFYKYFIQECRINTRFSKGVISFKESKLTFGPIKDFYSLQVYDGTKELEVKFHKKHYGKLKSGDTIVFMTIHRETVYQHYRKKYDIERYLDFEKTLEEQI